MGNDDHGELAVERRLELLARSQIPIWHSHHEQPPILDHHPDLLP